ncbi:alpha/beta hydrolase family protein [Dyella lipolytica]|uniref:Serine aminopeptidase, S33 n=1 Tax=Dyella lipolytica TaxID=1867835 RepID=A0ABW8IUF4_9GAMM|nr:hypothetical protein [Dyella lipolytica]
MSVMSVPQWLGPPGRRLFATWHGCNEPAGMTLVICPPLFHERVLGYRLFGLLAARLAAAGIACLRFDYYGTGDSAGDDLDFSLEGACTDIAIAVAAARAQSVGGGSVGLLAVRGGGWPAWSATVRDPSISHCWIWQPLTDGAEYLDALQRVDTAERTVRTNPPFCKAPSTSRDDGQLVGCACPESLRRELRDAQLPATNLLPGTSLGVLGRRNELDRATFATYRIELTESATQWADTLKVRATFLTKALTEPIDRLASVLLA